MSGEQGEQLNRLSHRRISAFGLALLAALAALIWFEPPWNLRLQSAWFDTYQVLKPRDISSSSWPVTVVEIDEKSLTRLGQWPWPRTVLAELLRDIESAAPRAIGVDIVMPEPDRLSPEHLLAKARQRDPVLAGRLDTLPSNDSELAQTIAAGPVILGLAGTPERGDHEPMSPPILVTDRQRHDAETASAMGIPHHAGALTNIDILDRAAAGHGLISAGPSDDVIRRLPLVAEIGDRYVPSLAIEMLRVAQRAPVVRLALDGASVRTIGVGNFVAPTEPDGELRIYYSGRESGRFVSAVDVLDGKFDPLRFQDKLVLIGVTGLATTDYQNTPLGVRMPGSEVLAQVLENLREQTWLTRPRWAHALEVAVFVLLGLALIWATPRWDPRNAALLATGCIALPVLAGFAAFASQRLVFDAAAPAAGLLALFSVLLVLTLAEAGRQRRRLERVVQAQRERAAYVSGELEAAQRIQTGFLPRTDLLRDDRRLDLAVSMTPAREVGGDLYDFFPLDDRRLFFLVGDVAGKGLSASMFMAVSKALYKSARVRNPGATVSEVKNAANAEISRDNPEMFFVTAFAGVLDLDSGELSYCNAGHENPWVLAPGRHDLLELGEGAGPPLCSVAGFAYSSAKRRMQAGEWLCLFSDGVIDARSAGGARYGRERLRAVLTRNANSPNAAALLGAVRAELKAFTQGAEAADDLTVLVLRWLGPRATA